MKIILFLILTSVFALGQMKQEFISFALENQDRVKICAFCDEVMNKANETPSMMGRALYLRAYVYFVVECDPDKAVETIEKLESLLEEKNGDGSKDGLLKTVKAVKTIYASAREQSDDEEGEVVSDPENELRKEKERLEEVDKLLASGRLEGILKGEVIITHLDRF